MKKILLAMFTTACLTAFAQDRNKQQYIDAFSELRQMQTLQTPISIKRAVFITENAFLENEFSYDEFSSWVHDLVLLAKAVEAADGLTYNGKDRKQVLGASAIYRVMKDTLVIHNNQQRVMVVPYVYDMQDFWGERDWTKMFVSKLLVQQSGNCHSMPLLYKIIAEEMGVDAWLAMAPNHTYIKQWNDKTGWYNTELTTGRFPFDSELKWNSYIKNEAIAEGIYMDTLSNIETVSYIMTDLVEGYVRRFGYEEIEIPISWLDAALEYYPDYLNAHILKAELKKLNLEITMKQAGISTISGIENKSALKQRLNDLTLQYVKIHELGYRRMPKEMYLNWLYRINKDSTKTPYKFSTPQPFNKYGYSVQYTTAGDGTMPEFYDQSPVVQIGSAEIDVVKKKIVNLSKVDQEDFPDEVVSRMYDPALGRWWQVDPLAEKYYSIAPYAFVANNPILFVDPDGREIWIAYGDNQRVKYENGKLYNEDGSKYKGKDDFVSSAYKSLNSMNSTKNGKTVLGDLSGSENAFTFTNTFAKDSKGNDITGVLSFDENKDGGGEIKAGALMTIEDEGQKVETVAHELFHGYQHENNQSGASVTNEVQAYLFGRSVALSSGLSYNYSFGKEGVVGGMYDNAMFNMLTNSTFDPKDLQQAVMTFKAGSRVNANNLYKRTPYTQKKPLIQRFYPLVDQ